MTRTQKAGPLTDDQIDYWTDVFTRLGIGQHGIRLDSFLADPYRYLRMAGMGQIKVNLDVLSFLPTKGTA